MPGPGPVLRRHGPEPAGLVDQQLRQEQRLRARLLLRSAQGKGTAGQTLNKFYIRGLP